MVPRYPAIATCVLLVASAAGAQSPVVHAARTSERIVIDGRLEDAVWASAPASTEFTQRDPDEGKPATEQTELRIAYDEDNLYFGIRSLDRDPSGIVQRLSRRDDESNADSFTIQLSPYHDGLTGAVFEVSAAGVQRDAIVSNDTNTDYSWDGVWESAVRVTDQGWVAEVRIPFSQLRFQSRTTVWAINAARYIQRKNETVWLRLVPKNESGLASRMHDLDGLGDVEFRKHLDLMPYVTNRSEFVEPASSNDPFNDGSRQFGAVGLDAKYGLSSNVTLDATVNPDFGQVEVDPAVVNLSAFETFFPEKRPFFLEGANIFNNFGNGGANNFFGFNRAEPILFYTRRIGRAPQGAARGEFIDRPSATTILGAGKLTGKTRTGWTFGLVDAVTDHEHAVVMSGAQRTRPEVEPRTNYFVGRVLREQGRSGIGLLTTGVQRDLRDPALRDSLTRQAYVLGADGYMFLDSRRDWVVHGRFSGSHVTGSAAAIDQVQRSSQWYFQQPDASRLVRHLGATSMSGWTGAINVNKNQGDKTLNASLWGVSPGFNSNDLGFQFRSDIGGAHVVGLWKKPNPDRLTRSRQIVVAKSWTWNYGGQALHDAWFTFGNATFLNYWSIFGIGAVFRQVNDDRLTRGGPIALNPRSYFFNLQFNTDARKKVSLRVDASHSDNAAGGWEYSGNLGITIKPTPSISVSTGPEVSRSRNVSQYVSASADAAAVQTFGTRYVFADLDQAQVSFTTRGHWILSPKMSVQVFAQPLISGGRYWDYKQFAQAATFSFLPYAAETVPGFANPDFNFKSLRVNAVFRWEWKLGSTLYVVWTENREDLSNPGHLSPGRDFGRLFTAPPNDIFQVRFSYWFSR
jgi:hypothetical protein